MKSKEKAGLTKDKQVKPVSSKSMLGSGLQKQSANLTREYTRRGRR